ncbi:hypothetical protein CUJ86_00050 [Methanofollis fontis]|uniref:Pectate lyase superfamily protein domain-containing protein n=1 Tax=Methanofollis fontis TaxID=2052832 RepID=A0A483CS70_9EURY|nr:hypothetical protein CUJ86_00050 [Methanofollis fontis]
MILLLCLFQAVNAATLVVAAGDSSATSKLHADYICDGISDQQEIQAAINAVSSSGGGTIVLSEGTFALSSSLSLQNDCVLEGRGVENTLITLSKKAAIFISPSVQGVTLENFKAVGEGCILIEGDHVRLHDITMTTGDTIDGAFRIMCTKDKPVIQDIEFINCSAIDCGCIGFINSASQSVASSAWVKDIRYTDCVVVNYGLSSRYNPWVCGFDLAELCSVDGMIVDGCYAEGNWESGFHFEPTTIRNVVLKDCISKNNAQKTAITGETCHFGAGFFTNGDVTLLNCTSSGTHRRGFMIRGGVVNATLVDCRDIGAVNSFDLSNVDGVVLENCVSENPTSTGFFIYASTNITQINCSVNPASSAQSPVSNVFAIEFPKKLEIFPLLRSLCRIFSFGNLPIYLCHGVCLIDYTPRYPLTDPQL